jgi:glyoxylase-like metal-dependent hydrolase (beta-lactamase superfamily II)
MREIAEGVFHIPLFPRDGVNAYLIGDVLIDAGVRSSAPALLAALKGRAVTAHALTHAHFDHKGASAAVCTALRIPFLCHAADKLAAESDPGVPTPSTRDSQLTRVAGRIFAGPGYPVTRALRGGDIVGGFEVIETPGHSPGHVVFWRAADRVLIGGDVLNAMSLITTLPGLREPPLVFTTDPARNRESIRKIAALRPAIAGFGHGPVWRSAESYSKWL